MVLLIMYENQVPNNNEFITWRRLKYSKSQMAFSSALAALRPYMVPDLAAIGALQPQAFRVSKFL